MRWQSTGAQVWSVDDSEWQNVLTSNTIPTVVPDGTAEGQTLRWDNTGSEWESTSDLVVDSSGNVGIGVTNPDEQLVVDGTAKVQSTASTTQLRLDRTDGDEWLLQAGLGAGGDEFRIYNVTEYHRSHAVPS